MNRRGFFRNLMMLGASLFGLGSGTVLASGATDTGREATGPLYGMGVDVQKCIGCNRCAEACRTENMVPEGRHRTWVERYMITGKEDVLVSQVGTSEDKLRMVQSESSVLRSFFVPKLCNQCDKPPCVQVCPVGATFKTSDGVVLVDDRRCIGCSYCVQACPYSARYIHPVTRTADKCTFCYHRVSSGRLPACVEVCPTQTRIFGDLRSTASPLTRFKRMHNVNVLKPYLNTKPKVLYADLDGEVR